MYAFVLFSSSGCRGLTAVCDCGIKNRVVRIINSYIDRIFFKVAGKQDRHTRSEEFDFGPDQTTHFGVTCH